MVGVLYRFCKNVWDYSGPDSNLASTSAVSGHPVLLLPVTKTEPESLSSDETDVSDTNLEGVSASKRASFKAFVF